MHIAGTWRRREWFKSESLVKSRDFPMESSKLDRLISELSDLANEATSGERRWNEVWAQIKKIGNSFKDVRYPTKDAREQAWNRFQEIVQGAKESQQEQRAARKNDEDRSSQLRNRIISQAESGRPLSEFESALADMIIGPIKAVAELYVDLVTLGTLRGEIDEKKEELTACSNNLRKAWNQFNEDKGEMLGRDKYETFQTLREIQEQLDAAWDNWKQLSGRYHEASQAAFRERVEASIGKLESRLQNLYGILSRRESHLSELESKRDSAWNDDFRERVAGWIDEEEDRISDIKEQIEQVERWLDEQRAKL